MPNTQACLSDYLSERLNNLLKISTLTTTNTLYEHADHLRHRQGL